MKQFCSRCNEWRETPERKCYKCGSIMYSQSEYVQKMERNKNFSKLVEQNVSRAVNVNDDKEEQIEIEETENPTYDYKKARLVRINILSVCIIIACVVGIIVITNTALNINKSSQNDTQNSSRNELILVNSQSSNVYNLNNKECEIYEALLIGIKDFYNPQAVRVLEIRNINDRGLCYLTITGQNRLGGTLQKFYRLVLNDSGYIKKGELSEYSDSDYQNIEQNFDIDKYVSVGNINRALKKHWEDLGID